MWFHGTIRKYTAALLDIFNEFEIQYLDSEGETLTRVIPLTYSSREKSRILDSYTSEQLLAGNYSVLPRASLALGSMSKLEARVTNKNNRIQRFRDEDTMEYAFNSVPYEFSYDLVVQCRGMNEATQILEQIAPRFNPIVNVDIWDAENLDEPTRVPLKLSDIAFETEEYDELSTNLITINVSLSLTGNIYQPIKSQERIKEFLLALNEVKGDFYTQRSLLDWDVDINGHVIGTGPDDDVPGHEGSAEPLVGSKGTVSLTASKISVLDVGNYFVGTTVEDVLQEIMGGNYQPRSEKGQPGGYPSLSGTGKIPLSQLPNYGSTVQEFVSQGSFPPTGDDDVIYVAQDTGKRYTWTGSMYEELSSFVELSKQTTQLSTPREIKVTFATAGSAALDFDGTANIHLHLTSASQEITTNRILISGNSATLPNMSLEMIVSAYIYDTPENAARVFSCTMALDGWSVAFDPLDNLEGLECTVRYFAAI